MLSSEHATVRAEIATHPALTDPETGLANRLHFELVYNYLFTAGARGMAFTVMLVATGSSEDLYRAAGTGIRSTTRSSDLVSHVGDGRYVVLLLGTNLQGGRIAADRIETALESVVDGPVSFGLAAWAADLEGSSALLDAAENALAAAEAAGGGVEFG